MKPESLLGGVVATTSLAVAVAVVWTLTAGMSSFTSESWRRASVSAAPRPLPMITVEDESGIRFALASMCSKVMVINFIYTQCPTICKGLGSTSSQLSRRFRDESLDATVMSLSFDPMIDTPERLRAFKTAMEPTVSPWHLARPLGTGARTRLLSTFGVVVIPDGLGGYDHNAGLHIVDQQCRLVKVLDADDIDGAAAMVRKLVPTPDV
jgi:protein SCO1